MKDEKEEFRTFLKNNKDNIHEPTLYQLLQTHGKIQECINFADDIGSYENLIVHYIN